ncbi:2TM domain-containing protein [Maribacter chungangensis]|uniref:2TM domain-containing protein n=1 Tax=Maribacter chungangensis TaxID=1069117 RepID=A0ABW3B3Q8_9FLAO
MNISKYERAKLRVIALRGFYNHLAVFVIVNILLYLLRNKFTIILINESTFDNPKFLEWIDWNVFGTTIIWGVILVIHALNVLGNWPLFKKEWEQRQIKKYLSESGD